MTVALLALLPLGSALAQGAPIPLLPQGEAGGLPSSPAPLPAPAPDAARPPDMVLESPAASQGGIPSPGNPRDERVQVQALGAPDPDATGVLDEAHGGFGTDMWAGARMAVVQKVLPLVPAPTPWLSLRRLERKLLLSTAAAPAGKPEGAPLIELRAEKLFALGDVDGLVALLKGVPTPAMTADLRRRLADAALLSGDTAAACDQAPSLKTAAPADPFAAKLQVFCQFASGKASEAGLGVDLLREQKLDDPAFFEAADALAGIAPGRMGAFADPNPLTLAMAGAAKLPLPESVAMHASSPGLLRAIALMPSATPAARLLAAEKAEPYGAVDTDTLRQLYRMVTFTPEELNAPLDTAAADKGFRSRALLFRAAEQQTMPAAKAEIIGKALSLAGDPNGYFTTARVYAPQIAGIKPAADLAWFAYPAARALFAAERADAARAWLAYARSQASAGNGFAVAAAGLAPLAWLAGRDDAAPLSPAAIAAWHRSRGALPAEAEQRRSAVLFDLLSALGQRLPADEWLPLLDGPPLVASRVPRPALWQGLRIATEDLRLAETVMFALASLGDSGLAQADPDELYRVVAALRLIGLDADARALAVEAAIANGV